MIVLPPIIFTILIILQFLIKILSTFTVLATPFVIRAVIITEKFTNEKAKEFKQSLMMYTKKIYLK
jgi:hypothetical protein